MQEAWTRVGDRLVRSWSTGELADNPEVVILPGLGAPDYVEPWACELGRWTRATVLDLPGWRRGRGQASPSTVEGVAAGAASWLTETDRRDVVLVGHSSGSQSAIRVALALPERLSAVVLAGPTLDPSARNPVRLVSRFLRTIVAEKLSELPAVLPWYLRSGGFAWLRLVRSVVRDRPEDLVGDLDRPVLVITGTRDRFAPPAFAQHLAERSAGRYETLPGAHNACFTFPVAAAAAVHRAVLGGAREPGP